MSLRLRFILELVDAAFLRRDVIPGAQIYGLEEAAAPVGVQVAHLHHVIGFGNFLIRRDRDIADGNQIGAVK
jgi:hypothetical protein